MNNITACGASEALHSQMPRFGPHFHTKRNRGARPFRVALTSRNQYPNTRRVHNIAGKPGSTTDHCQHPEMPGEGHNFTRTKREWREATLAPGSPSQSSWPSFSTTKWRSQNRVFRTLDALRPPCMHTKHKIHTCCFHVTFNSRRISRRAHTNFQIRKIPEFLKLHEEKIHKKMVPGFRRRSFGRRCCRRWRRGFSDTFAHIHTARVSVFVLACEQTRC